MTRPIALVSARAARGLDEDEPLLCRALTELGAAVEVAEWDDPQITWSRFSVAVLRSTWDYAERLDAFLEWAERASGATTLLNPLPLVRWNTDKHYLGELTRAGVPVIPTCFVEPGEDAAAAVHAFLSLHPQAAEVVVKPAVGAGSRDVRRHGRQAVEAILAHVQQLLCTRRSVLLQPYLARVDEEGETALIYLDGVFSHAIRKGPLLAPGAEATSALFAPEHITPRTPRSEELDVAERALAALQRKALAAERPLYARIDLIRAQTGHPLLLELELTEPSLFLAHAPQALTRFAAQVLARAR